ncbi:MAG: S-methyl-5'-thioadenosine phosphorylase [Thermoplasmata archaeon]
MLKLGIIGGSGIADAGFFEEDHRKELDTPFGKPSAPYIIGKSGNLEVVFLPRHGIGHSIPPHKINYRANIWGMKEMGVTHMICPSAVGSLRADYKPGEIAISDQYVDFTKRRELTFFDGPEVKHTSMAYPFCEGLTKMLAEICKDKSIHHHKRGTYICIEGPRFSTKAESRMFRNYADIIGMTLVPEVQLARELGICYANLAMVTDYDVWAEKPVNMEEVISTMRANADKITDIIEEATTRLPDAKGCRCRE